MTTVTKKARRKYRKGQAIKLTMYIPVYEYPDGRFEVPEADHIGARTLEATRSYADSYNALAACRRAERVVVHKCRVELVAGRNVQ
jgi:hypothetical protein